MALPEDSVLRAFDTVGALEAVESNSGRRCYKSTNRNNDIIVLRPLNDDDEDEVNWMARLLRRLPGSKHYRLPWPISANVTQMQLSRDIVVETETETVIETAEEDSMKPGNCDDNAEYVHNGWMAQTFINGRAGTQTVEEFVKIMRASRALHKDIRELRISKPTFLKVSDEALRKGKRTRWREADAVVWGEKRLKDVLNVSVEALEYFQPVIGKLKALLQSMSGEGMEEYQIIHGDLNGNVLFDNDLSLGIIDFTPYWRPARYAEAIVVADALVWYRHVLNGNEEDLFREFGLDEVGSQLLVRAVYWKCLMFCIERDFEWVRRRVSKADFVWAVQLLEGMKTKM